MGTQMGRYDRTHFKEDNTEMWKASPTAREVGLYSDIPASLLYFYIEILSLPCPLPPNKQ